MEYRRHPEKKISHYSDQSKSPTIFDLLKAEANKPYKQLIQESIHKPMQDIDDEFVSTAQRTPAEIRTKTNHTPESLNALKEKYSKEIVTLKENKIPYIEEKLNQARIDIIIYDDEQEEAEMEKDNLFSYQAGSIKSAIEVYTSLCEKEKKLNKCLNDTLRETINSNDAKITFSWIDRTVTLRPQKFKLFDKLSQLRRLSRELKDSIEKGEDIEKLINKFTEKEIKFKDLFLNLKKYVSKLPSLLDAYKCSENEIDKYCKYKEKYLIALGDANKSLERLKLALADFRTKTDKFLKKRKEIEYLESEYFKLLRQKELLIKKELNVALNYRLIYTQHETSSQPETSSVSSQEKHQVSSQDEHSDSSQEATSPKISPKKVQPKLESHPLNKYDKKKEQEELGRHGSTIQLNADERVNLTEQKVDNYALKGSFPPSKTPPRRMIDSSSNRDKIFNASKVPNNSKKLQQQPKKEEIKILNDNNKIRKKLEKSEQHSDKSDPINYTKIEDYNWVLKNIKQKCYTIGDLEEELQQYIMKDVPSKGNNCLLYALMMAAGHDLTKEEVHESINKVRTDLENDGIVEKGQMLDPTDICGLIAIRHLLKERGDLGQFTELVIYAANETYKTDNNETSMPNKTTILLDKKGDKSLYIYYDGKGGVGHYYALIPKNPAQPETLPSQDENSSRTETFSPSSPKGPSALEIIEGNCTIQ